MLINPLLKEMDLHDLNRRYSNTFVRYNDEVVFIGEFVPIIGGIEFSYTTIKSRLTKKFNHNLLDITRPQPRWIISDKRPYYLNYIFDRQWHRGFCKQNSKIRSLGRDVNLLPSLGCISLLQKFYDDPWEKINISTDEVKKRCMKDGSILLSPQVLVSGDDLNVYFRELYIGNLGKVYPAFTQELKELVKDYVNEDTAFPVRNQNPRGKQERPLFRFQGVVDGVVQGNRNDAQQFEIGAVDWARIQQADRQLFDDLLEIERNRRNR